MPIIHFTHSHPRDLGLLTLEEVYRTAGIVDWLVLRVRELEAGSLVWGKAEETEDGVKFKAGVNAWVQLLQQERSHLVRVSKEAIAAGIEERKVRLAEQQGALLATVIRAILGDLELTPEQVARVPEVVPRHLRALTS